MEKDSCPQRIAAALRGFEAALRARGISTRGAFGTSMMPIHPPAAVESWSASPAVVEFLIPLTRNNGVAVTTEELIALFQDLYDTCGGASFSRADGFVAAAAAEIDCHLRFTVWTHDLPGVRALVRRWLGRLDQREIDILVTHPLVLRVRADDLKAGEGRLAGRKAESAVDTNDQVEW